MTKISSDSRGALLGTDNLHPLYLVTFNSIYDRVVWSSEMLIDSRSVNFCLYFDFVRDSA